MAELRDVSALTRRRFLGMAAGVAGMSTVGLLGCGGGGGTPSATPSSSIGNAKASRPLTLWNWDVRPAWVAALTTIVNDFKKESGITVDVVAIPAANLSQKLEASIASNTLPDLYYGETSFPAYVEQGILVQLDDVAAAIGKDKFFPAMMTYSAWKGHTYSLPFVNYPRVVWYRKDYFSARNIKQPTTWNEMTQAANALNDPANNRYGFLNYNLYPDQPPLEDLMITNNAVAVNKQGKVTIDSPATIGALNMIGELSKYSPPGSETTSQQAMRLPFGKGQGAMMITSTSVADVLAADPANAPLYGAFPIPINAGSRNGIIAVGAWWVTKNAEVDAAKRFLEFFFRDDTYTKFAQSTVIGHLPTLQPVASSSAYLNSPRIKPWASAIASASAVTSHGSLWAQELGLNTEAAPIGTARVANQMQDMLVISKQSAKAVASWGQNTATQAVEQSH